MPTNASCMPTMTLGSYSASSITVAIATSLSFVLTHKLASVNR